MVSKSDPTENFGNINIYMLFVRRLRTANL